MLETVIMTHKLASDLEKQTVVLIGGSIRQYSVCNLPVNGATKLAAEGLINGKRLNDDR